MIQPEVMTNIVETIFYFFGSSVLLLLSFYVLDKLTPGKLHKEIFINHKFNAAVVASSNVIALTIIMFFNIMYSESMLDVLIYGVIALVLQSLIMLVVFVIIPGNFKNVIIDSKPRPSAMLVGLIFISLGVVNAVCLT